MKSFGARLPKCLLLLHNLRHLSLALPYGHLDPLGSSPSDSSLPLLPSQLQTLEISSLDDDLTLRLYSPLEVTSEHHHRFPPTHPEWFFPFKSLTTLSINASFCNIEQYRALPSTLTKLSEHTVHPDGDQPIMSALPRGLLEWYCCICPESFKFSNFWRDPPPLLHTLKTVEFPLLIQDYKVLSLLPHSLTELTIDVNTAQPENVNSFVEALPPGIRNLDLGMVQLQHFDRLGADLSTIWGIKVSKMAVEAWDDFDDENVCHLIRSLPVSMISLSLHLTLPMNILPSYWPPLLTDLDIHGCQSLEVLRCLPSTLKSLSLHILGTVDRCDDHDIPLPPSLTQLQFYLGFIESFQFLHPLPPSLRSMVFTTSDKRLSLQLVAFPPQLDTLILTFSHVVNTLDERLLLPSRLTELCIAQWSFVELDRLPSTLVHFEVSDFLLPEDVLVRLDLWQDLPRSLEKIDLSSRDLPVLWPKFTFPSLPRLIYFRLWLGYFDPSLLAHLPRKLDFIGIQLSHWNDEAYADLISPRWREQMINRGNYRHVVKK